MFTLKILTYLWGENYFQLLIHQTFCEEEDWNGHRAHILLLVDELLYESTSSELFAMPGSRKIGGIRCWHFICWNESVSLFGVFWILMLVCSYYRLWKKLKKISGLWDVCFVGTVRLNQVWTRLPCWCKKYVKRTLLLSWFTSWRYWDGK